jgi:hypothetical protein
MLRLENKSVNFEVVRLLYDYLRLGVELELTVQRLSLSVGAESPINSWWNLKAFIFTVCQFLCKIKYFNSR